MFFGLKYRIGFFCSFSVNKQLADKERVAAALENSSLLEVVNQCLSTRSHWAPTCSQSWCYRHVELSAWREQWMIFMMQYFIKKVKIQGEICDFFRFIPCILKCYICHSSSRGHYCPYDDWCCSAEGRFLRFNWAEFRGHGTLIKKYWSNSGFVYIVGLLQQ